MVKNAIVAGANNATAKHIKAVIVAQITIPKIIMGNAKNVNLSILDNHNKL